MAEETIDAAVKSHNLEVRGDWFHFQSAQFKPHLVLWDGTYCCSGLRFEQLISWIVMVFMPFDTRAFRETCRFADRELTSCLLAAAQWLHHGRSEAGRFAQLGTAALHPPRAGLRHGSRRGFFGQCTYRLLVADRCVVLPVTRREV